MTLMLLFGDYQGYRAGSADFSSKSQSVNGTGSAVREVSADCSAASVAGKQPQTIGKGMAVAVFQENLIYKNKQPALSLLTPGLESTA